MFDLGAVLVLESTIPDGRRRRPWLSQTKTNSAQAGAGARAELGKNFKHFHMTFSKT